MTQGQDTDQINKTRFKEILIKIFSSITQVLPKNDLLKGSSWILGISIIIGTFFIGSDLHSGFGLWIDILGSGLLAGLGYFLLQAIINWVLSFFVAPIARLTAIISSGMVLLLSISDLKEDLVFLPIVFLVVTQSLLGGAITYILKGNWKRGTLGQKILTTLALVFSVSANIFFIYWLVSPGTDSHLIEFEPIQGKSSIEVPNPTEPGSYEIIRFSYGSGTDLRRDYYGENVDLISKTVNASSYFYNPNPNFQDFKDWFNNMGTEEFPLEDWIESRLRLWYWGFDRTAFPLNAQVWFPEGNGPFPLVLMVHGNHDMADYSEFGYAYLGELLASRGYIFVSVDENFLNGYFAGGISGENDARGWMLLKHLEQLEDWHDAKGNPFTGKIDLSKIALVGHSRGGEAVSVAAAFNQLDRYPDNGNVKFNFNFNIQSVIAIAPVDQQYQPADLPLPLIDINYLVMQGAHDGDVSSFTGLRQYQRVKFTDPNSNMFKAALYIYQANHSQFNSDWGSQDLGLPRGQYLNIKPLLSPDQQREISTLYISAFLDVTLKDQEGYQPIFENFQYAGDWLPPTLYVNQFQSASYLPIATFEEDINLTSSSILGGFISTSGLSQWKEVELEYRSGKNQDNHVVQIGWSGSRGEYKIDLPYNFMLDNQLNRNSFILFNLGDNRTLPQDLINMSISLTDGDFTRSTITLDKIAIVYPTFISKFSKYDPWELDKYKKSSESILQTVRIPISAFLDIEPRLDIENLTQISFSFNQTANGRIFLDEIGFEK